jgi:hypothetical protein
MGPSGEIVNWKFFCKRREIWNVPGKLMTRNLSEEIHNLITTYSIQNGDYLISTDVNRARTIFTTMCKRAGLRPLIMHDLRKMGLTARCIAGVPLEIAVTQGVGWLNTNVAKNHYLTVKKLNEDAEFGKFVDYITKANMV